MLTDFDSFELIARNPCVSHFKSIFKFQSRVTLKRSRFSFALSHTSVYIHSKMDWPTNLAYHPPFPFSASFFFTFCPFVHSQNQIPSSRAIRSGLNNLQCITSHTRTKKRVTRCFIWASKGWKGAKDGYSWNCLTTRRMLCVKSGWG
jgi:hypothetical protein